MIFSFCLLSGTSCPRNSDLSAVRGWPHPRLALALLVLGILANDAQYTLAPNEFALLANQFDRRSHFHSRSTLTSEQLMIVDDLSRKRLLVAVNDAAPV